MVTKPTIPLNSFFSSATDPAISSFPIEVASTEGEIFTVPKNTILQSQNGPGEFVFFIVQGKVKISMIEHNAKEVTLNILQEGQLFGDEILIGLTSSGYQAKAMSVVKLRRYTKAQIEQKINNDNEFTWQFIACLIQKCQRVQKQWNSKIKELARPRIIRFLVEYGRKNGQKIGYETVVHKFYSHQELATLTGSARQTVSSVLNELKKNNHILFDRRKILYRDLDKLAAELDK